MKSHEPFKRYLPGPADHRAHHGPGREQEQRRHRAARQGRRGGPQGR